MHPLQQEKNPRRKAGLISQLFFIWLIPLFQKGFRKTLQLSDLYRVLPSDESRLLGDQLEQAWNKELEKSAISRQLEGKEYQPSLTKALTKVFGPSFAAYGVFAFYEECIVKISQPICFGILLRYFLKPDDFPSYAGPLLGAGVVFLSICYTSSDHPFTFAVQHLGMKIRISLCSLIYRKALRMSMRALEDTSASHIINFLSSDMGRFDILMTFLHYIWVAPIQFTLAIIVLYQYLNIGWPCFSGIGLILIFVPFQGLMGRVYSRLRQETVDKTDRRLLIMDELISAMRVIKMYAWESVFTESIRDARLGEIVALRKAMYWKASTQSLFYITSRITLFLTLLGYVLIGNSLTAEIVFVSLALYYSIENVMMMFFPAAVISLAETSITIRRFQDFLLLQEKPLLPGCYEDESPIPTLEVDKETQQPDNKPGAAPQQDNNARDGGEGDENDDSDDDDDDNDDDTVDSLDPSSVSSQKPKVKSKLGFLEKIVQENLLVMEETTDNHSEKTLPQPPAKHSGVVVKNVSGQWVPLSHDMAFNNVSCRVKRGEILAIVGPVGSGKSSLVQAILGELPISSGELAVKGSVAYTSHPWIFPGSVRENILFGLEFDSDWYDQVIDACALSLDLTLLPYGDHTLVGDRGETLSGGQKARIGLARAVYSDADVFLLDDPLCSVDPQVGRRLMNKCILGLLKDKVRILITHQLQYLPFMTRILLLVDGWPKYYGDFETLLTSGIPYAGILTRLRNENSAFTTNAEPSMILPVNKESSGAMSHNFDKISSYVSPSRHVSSATLVLDSNPKSPHGPTHQEIIPYGEGNKNSRSATIIPTTTNVNNLASKQPPTPEANPDQEEPTPVDEELAIGHLNSKLYWSYFSAGSSCTALFILIASQLACQVIFTCTDLWLQFWMEAEGKNKSAIPEARKNFKQKLEGSRDAQIIIYAMLIILLSILSLARSLNFYRVCMQTSVELHDRLLSGVLRSPMSFFETNPTGRILNRFAKDIGVIDEALPTVSFDTIEITLQFVGVIVVVSIGSPIMLIPAVIMVIAFYSVRKFYFKTGRAIKRLEGLARSPVFSHISTSLNGLGTIRAFGCEAMFQKQFESYLDVHSSVWYLFLASSRWLGIVVDWLAILFVAAVMINAFVSNQDDAVAGLSLTSAMMLTSMLQWGIRQSAELTNQMVCVERVMEFCDLKPEAALESEPENRPPRSWPEKGEIRIQNMSLRYGDDSPVVVLKNINCIIYGGEKIGVVGRTGAGKSSLLSALFRIVEPSEGFIEIDGVITNSIGLHDLRSRLSIIPQDPVLFMGSIRKNLDPFHKFTDSKVWEVLKDVNLEQTVQDMPLGIYSQIAEGGLNFSMGQKQLFCLARAILRNNQILVLDEATANCDPETDALIQRTLRTDFADCTVITIAHRLHTIMDCDRIIVMDAGKIMEMDEPDVLLRNRNSALYKLAQETGKSEAAIARRRGMDEQ